MKWDSLLELVRDEPTFTSALLLAGEASSAQVRLQLSRTPKPLPKLRFNGAPAAAAAV